MNSSKVGLQQDMTTAQYLLENLGFVINLEKSCFQPTQQLEFLGFVVNTLDMTLLLPDCKVEAIKSHCSKMLLHHEVSVRELSQLIGKLTASIQAIFPAPLHYRHLHDLKHKALARFGHFDATTALSTEAKDELQWWLAHINCLELLAGSFAVKSFTKDRLCVHVRLRMDNVSAVAYINRLGGTHSLILSNLAPALWEWALKRSIFLSAEHLSGALNVPLVDAGQRSLRAIPVRESSERPVNPVLQLEAGSDGPSNRRPLAELANRETIRISPLLSYNALSGEAQGRGGRTHTGDSCVANTGLVSESFGIVGLPSDSLTLGSQITSGPAGSITPVGDESNPATSRLACVQRSLQSKGISSNASKLILAAWRPSTNSVYNSAWKKWHCWCIAREVDPLCPSLADITGFLAHSFDEGLEYRTINTYRSALSGVLPPMEGFPVGQHPLVVRLLKGILNLRPAMPRY